MPRDYPHRITGRKLLKFTGQSQDCQEMLARLKRHERAVRALKQLGLEYDPKTGRITRKS